MPRSDTRKIVLVGNVRRESSFSDKGGGEANRENPGSEAGSDSLLPRAQGPLRAAWFGKDAMGMTTDRTIR